MKWLRNIRSVVLFGAILACSTARAEGPMHLLELAEPPEEVLPFSEVSPEITAKLQAEMEDRMSGLGEILEPGTEIHLPDGTMAVLHDDWFLIDLLRTRFFLAQMQENELLRSQLGEERWHREKLGEALDVERAKPGPPDWKHQLKTHGTVGAICILAGILIGGALQ